MQNLFNKEDISLKLGNQLSYSQIHLIKNISLGNVFVDTILQFFIVSIFIQIIINLGFIINYIYLLFSNSFKLMSDKLSSRKIIITNKSPKLFKAVKKYLSTLTICDNYNYNFNNNLHEYSYDENIKIIKKINLDENKSNIIIYNKYYILTFLYDNIHSFNNSKIILSFSNINNNYFDIDDFLSTIIKSYDNYLVRNSIKNVYNNIDDIWVCNEIDENNNLDSIILDTKLKEEIIKDIQNFIKDNSKNKYNSFNIPFTKTYLFYGSHGTGKSEFIKVLANYFNYNLYYLNLENVISESNVISLLNNINDKKSILVIENICLNNNTLSYSHIQSNEDINYYNNLYYIEKTNNILNIIYNDKNIILPELIILTTNQNKEQEENYYNNLSFIDVKYKFNNCSIEQFKSFYTKFYNNIIPLNILNKIETSLFSPLQLIKIYLNNINNEKKFLLDISKKNIVNIDDDIHNNFNNSILLTNNKLILSAIVITHFSYLFKTYDNIIKSKYKVNYYNNLTKNNNK
jgi:energy-coupling factor transporter ATP-binding protein EcfA2